MIPKGARIQLDQLEAEGIDILREVVAECERPVLLYSIGKDSSVLLHLARKAFFPGPLPFLLLHVDTTWKFRETYAMREQVAQAPDVRLIVHLNADAQSQGINPFDHGSAMHTDQWMTQGLKQALKQYGFDAAIGGARRDEEKSRVKERIFSFRDAEQHWGQGRPRAEIGSLYNLRKLRGSSIGVFPLSNWTELDVWRYIVFEQIDVVSLYFAAERPVVEREGNLVMVDDDRMRLRPGELPIRRMVRFRTLGCYPLTGAVLSSALTAADVMEELGQTRRSERSGRAIDVDGPASMESKKKAGYF